MRSAPFGHARNEHAFRRIARRTGDVVIQLVQRLTRPKGLIKDSGIGLGFAKIDVLLNDDGLRPKGRPDQHQHDDFNRDGRFHKKRQQGEIDLLRHRKGCLFHDLLFFCLCRCLRDLLLTHNLPHEQGYHQHLPVSIL